MLRERDRYTLHTYIPTYGWTKLFGIVPVCEDLASHSLHRTGCVKVFPVKVRAWHGTRSSQHRTAAVPDSIDKARQRSTAFEVDDDAAGTQHATSYRYSWACGHKATFRDTCWVLTSVVFLSLLNLSGKEQGKDRKDSAKPAPRDV